MRKYITRLSLEDFKNINSEIADDLEEEFPYCVAVSNKGYPLPYNMGTSESLSVANVKHIYSTRDYWEVHTTTGAVNKVPKKLTKAIYQIEVK